MIISSRLIAMASVMVAGLLGACQTTATKTTAPAMLKSGDAKSMVALKSELAKAMGKSTVELGAGDPTQHSSVSVLPSNNETLGHNTAMPTHFDIMMKGNDCYAIRRDTGEEFLLEGVACRPT